MASLAVIGVITSVAGTVYGAIQSAQQASFQAEIADRNAQAARFQAEAEESRYRRDAARQMGRTRAAFGAAGTTLSGSALDVLADQAMELEENALLIRHGGFVRSTEQQLRASSFRSQVGPTILGGSLQAAGGLASGLNQAGFSFGSNASIGAFA